MCAGVLGNWCIFTPSPAPCVYLFSRRAPPPAPPPRTVERLDLELGRWVSVEPMLSRRSTLGVAVLDEQLYAVGGFDGTNGLDTVEKYNPGEVAV